jgi:hypothetical protein
MAKGKTPFAVDATSMPPAPLRSAMDVTSPSSFAALCAGSTSIHPEELKLVRLKRRTPPSEAPVAARVPSSETATALIETAAQRADARPSLWSRSATSFRSKYALAVPSAAPLTATDPFPLSATLRMSFVWPSNRPRTFRFFVATKVRSGARELADLLFELARSPSTSVAPSRLTAAAVAGPGIMVRRISPAAASATLARLAASVLEPTTRKSFQLPANVEDKASGSAEWLSIATLL